MSAFKPRLPDYRIKVKTRVEEGERYEAGEVGCAWQSDNGNITIKLNPGVVLSWNDGLVITAFPTAIIEEKTK